MIIQYFDDVDKNCYHADLIEHSNKLLGTLDSSKIILVYMRGSIVNLKVSERLSQYREE